MTETSRLPMLKQLSTCWQTVFTFDLRSLAVFRILLGILILWDLAFRWPTLAAMMTGDGLYTSQLSGEYYRQELGANWSQYVWSLFWLNDSLPFVRSLFAIAGIAALFLIVGKWTRIATVVSWLLVASLHSRNPMITTSGDFVFKLMLFWSMFLPLGARWSLDARKKSSPETSFCSFATVGYLLLIFILYFFPGIAKWNDIWWKGDAMWFVFRLDIYIKQPGRAMLQYPGILKLVSWSTLFFEIAWIWTLFSPWKNTFFRLSNLAVFWAFHIGIGLCLTIGLFPWICMIAWVPLIPAWCWERTAAPAIDSRFNWNRLSLVQLGAELFCIVALAISLVWNISNIEYPWAGRLRVPLISQLGYQLGLQQHFRMFGVPPNQNPWFVYEAQLVDGTQIDIFRNAAIDLERPEWGRKAFPQFHWRKLHRNATLGVNSFIRQPLLDYAVKKWNADHGAEQQVVRARLLAFVEKIGPDYNEQNFHSSVWGSYESESGGPGSLFDSISTDDEFDF